MNDDVVATGSAATDGIYEYMGTISEVKFANVSDKEEFARVAADYARRVLAEELSKRLNLTNLVVNECAGTFTASFKDRSHLHWSWTETKGLELT